ncbi:peptidoglycan DD-metalloendopeptidase family protein [Streptomyces sp. NPDC002935]|uniref:aggregation-promoting factor C-terminal-like domain-containing protein n=1 Tax=Streptomyces sp. NPDC002935 TaxID=3154545 RepID=UPI00339F8DDD
MSGDLDIVGGAAVDVVPIVPNFHRDLKTAVLPIADKVGLEAGRKLGKRMSEAMRVSLAGDGQRIGNDLGDAIGDAMARRIVTALPNAINNGGRVARTAALRQGNEVGGAFARSIKSRLEVAFRSLPKADVRLSDVGFTADLARLRARMETLSNKTVGVDLDAGAALAEIQAIDAELARLGANHADVNVRADTASARAELAAVQHQINDVDRDDVRVRVTANTAQANAALLQLAISLGAVAALPLVPIAAAGIGAIAAAAVAAGAGVAALALAAIPAIKGVTTVIQAKSAAEKEAATATDSSAAANVRGAQRAIQMASAQQALTSAHRNAARSIAQANRQVEDAERAVAQAAQRAADQRRQAAESVERAERSLSDAKRQARQAEEDLTQARRDATQQLADLNDKLEQGKLDERDATLRVREAQEELNRVQAEYDAGRATDLQLERAQLAYDQSVEAAKQQHKDSVQLQADAAKAQAAGVDGNEAVKSATEQLADAQRNVQDQVKAVADAQRDAARAQVEAAQSVVDAQRGLSDAVASAADAQVQAAESITSAERGVESARLSGIDTTTHAVTKSEEYRKALAKLTPDQRDLYDSIAGPKGLTKAFKDWSKSLQPDVLPLFTRGVDGAKASLPGLSPLVTAAADAVGILMDKASKELKSPFWRGFKKDIRENVKPAIVGLGVAFGNVFKGIAGIVDAFLPHMDGISATMQRITERFANWATNLKGSPEFERFLQYVHEHGPVVAETLGKLGGAFFGVAKALEPFTDVILELLGDVADGISWVADNAPWAIQLMYGLWIATRLWTLAMNSNPVGLVILGLIALALAVKYAWDHFEWFRDVVTGTWDVIKDVTLGVWEHGLKPAFDGIVWALKGIGDISVWLWKEIFVPVWNGIWLVMRIAIAVILTVLIAPLVIAFTGVGLLLGWLWTDCFKPTFDAIAFLATWLWENVLSPVFTGIWDGIKWLGDQFVWLYDHAVKPTFGGIATLATWLWDEALSPTFSGIWDGIKWLGGRFKWLYDHGVKPPMEFIADIAGWLYDKGLKPAFDKMKTAIGLVSDAFKDAKKAIKEAWYGVAGIAARPVNFIVEWVYTKGIKAVWDKVADFVHLDKLPNAPKLLSENPKFLEAGGTVGSGWGVAAPMKTNKPTAIVGEGNPRYPEYVIPTDPKYRDRAVALHRDAGTQLLAKGGVIGGAWDWTKDSVGDVIGTGIDWAKTGADLLKHPGKVWDKLLKPVFGKVSQGVAVAGKLGTAVGRLPLKMGSGLKKMIVDAATSMLYASEGTGGQWIKPVNVPFGTRFGVSGKMWSSGHHTGLDFPAAVGTRINAVDDGKVSSATGGGPYGNHVTISHGGGLSSLYAHMSRILTSAGQVVKQGQEIGKVGATGNVTGPHLHLEARVNGRATDPMKYLTGGGGFAGNASGAAQKYAKSILGNYGWGPGQFGPLQKLWTGESGWRWNAKNPSSGAYGIPQALPASKMASAGSDWRTNARTQIRWGLDYIKHRPDYGTPAAAYSKWLSRSPHWYDDGGMIPPGLSLVANGTGRPEPVFTSGQWEDIRASRHGGAPAVVQVKVDSHTYLDGREVGGYVDQRIEAHDAETGRAIDTGRWV